MTAYTNLFSPGMINMTMIPNRIISAPCEKNYANADGTITQRYLDYLAERAKGGTGLIIIESMYVHPFGKNRIAQLGIHSDEMMEGLKRTADMVHQYGSMIATELQYGGRQSPPWALGIQPQAPSPIPCQVLTGGFIPRELSVTEIKDIVTYFGEAAARAKAVGFDVIEIHGAHGYLLNQFLSPYTNKRTDEYGGTPEKRMRFPLEVVAEVRKAVGDDYPLAYRITADEHIDGGLRFDDLVPFIQRLELEGINLLDISAGIYESVIWIAQPMAFPRACLLEYAKKAKQIVDMPISIVGRINNPDLAEKILEDGDADFIAMGRPLHADPFFPRKAKEGRVDEIRICPACMSCSDELGAGAIVSCAINPAAGREREFDAKPASVKKKVMIIGGGPAGIKAASVAALRGHDVTLYEQNDILSGQLNYAVKPPHKAELREVIKSLTKELELSGATVKTGEKVSLDIINSVAPDVVIFATGAEAAVPSTPGLDLSRDNVSLALDIVDGKVKPKGKVLLMGAGLVGCETALMMADQGLEVVLTEVTSNLAGSIGLREGWFIRNELQDHEKIDLRLNTTVEKIDGNTVKLQKDGSYEEVEVDHVVLAVGMVSNNKLLEDYYQENKEVEIYAIGDVTRPRKIKDAIYEGMKLALQL